jgi:hypothetical protein
VSKRDLRGRRKFLERAALAALACSCRPSGRAPRTENMNSTANPNAAPKAQFDDAAKSQQAASGRMPVVFVGHGSPMNAITDNIWSRGFRELGRQLPRPRAILAVSAHWFVGGTFLTNQERPETIHDFGGFPRELHEVSYPAPGDPALAEAISRLLASHGAAGGSTMARGACCCTCSRALIARWCN